MRLVACSRVKVCTDWPSTACSSSPTSICLHCVCIYTYVYFAEYDSLLAKKKLEETTKLCRFIRPPGKQIQAYLKILLVTFVTEVTLFSRRVELGT